MNIPYLIKTISSNKLSEVVGVLDMLPLDMNLALWDSEAAGDIRIDNDKDRIEVLIPEEDVQPWHDPELTSKILRVIQHYTANEVNINRGRLDTQVKDPITGKGYPAHEYLMSLQYLIDSGQIVQEVMSIPGVRKKRPPHKFAFLCLPENAEFNAEWNAKQVNHWIATFENNKVK